MGIVVFDVSMSLDGFITGANPRPVEGWEALGEGGERLHDWGFNSTDPRNRAMMEWFTTVGAVIVGRTTYDLSIRNWGADGPTGPARIPTIAVSHSVPQDIPQNGVYTFVNGVEAALERAKQVAGEQNIYIASADIARQLISLGLVDEISIHLVPVLFGSGTRLFRELDERHVPLETIGVIETADAIHLRFRVAR